MASLPAADRADVVGRWIEQREIAHRETGNPLHAWFAYSDARVGGVPVPSWVLSYFDECAARLRERCCGGNRKADGQIYSSAMTAEDTPKEVAPAVAEALAFKRAGRSGRGNAFLAFDDRDEVLAIAVFRERGARRGRRTSRGEDDAFEKVAKEHATSRAVVARAWAKWGSAIVRP